MIPLHDDNPTRIVPVVTICLIVSCVLVFLWEVSAGPVGQQQIVFSLGLIPAVFLGNAQLPPEISLVSPLATVVTSMFLHGGWMHLIGNMLYLWIFGNNVEDAMGHVRFIFFGAVVAKNSRRFYCGYYVYPKEQA
jgi:membrane associated rhomboid family serine protease